MAYDTSGRGSPAFSIEATHELTPVLRPGGVASDIQELGTMNHAPFHELVEELRVEQRPERHEALRNRARPLGEIHGEIVLLLSVEEARKVEQQARPQNSDLAERIA